jgi:ACS family glucarate transporter-like MFS transporter
VPSKYLSCGRTHHARFGLSRKSMGRMFSAFVLGYPLFQIPAGAAADRWEARLVLGSAALAWVLITVGIAGLGRGPWEGGAVSSFVVLLGWRFVLGVVQSPTFPASAQGGMAQWIPPVHQGFANGIVLEVIGS